MRGSREPKRIAVIGAGAAGLVSAREAARQGHSVSVYEKSGRVGGVWVYVEETEDDLLGQRSKRPLHGSLYQSLQTNLPKELMAFRDFPFDSSGGGDDSWDRYIAHELVLQYLENFAKRYELFPYIRFGSEIRSVRRYGESAWTVETEGGDCETYDAVMVCNGHYSEPRVPAIEGIEGFRGELMHSHNYRTPDRFRGKRVAIWGAAASGVDIAREIAEVAETVYWCAEEHVFSEGGKQANLELLPSPKGFDANGALHVADGPLVTNLDAFLYCTGYHYAFPFLEEGVVTVRDNWVHPLYRDMIPPDDPTIIFIGIPYSVIPFPLFELQAKWFAKAISGEIGVVDKSEMHAQLDAAEARFDAEGRIVRNYHKLGGGQFEYMNLLAKECGEAPLPDWFEPLAKEVSEKRTAAPWDYRKSPLSG